MNFALSRNYEQDMWKFKDINCIQYKYIYLIIYRIGEEPSKRWADRERRLLIDHSNM